MTQEALRKPGWTLELVLSRAERVIGLLLLGLGGLAAIFSGVPFTHIGAPLFLLSLIVIVIGLVAFVGGTALARRWPGRWLLQLPLIGLLAWVYLLLA